MTQNLPTLDVRRVLARFSGEGLKVPKQYELIARRMRDAGIDPPPIATVRQWIARGQIPGAWLAAFALIAKTLDRKFDLSRYVRTDANDRRPLGANSGDETA